MNPGKGIILLVLCMNNINAAIDVDLASMTIKPLEEASQAKYESAASVDMGKSGKLFKSPENYIASENERMAEARTIQNSFMKQAENPVEQTVEKPVEKTREKPAEESCSRPRHQVLVRRGGCFAILGSGLLATSKGLARAGAGLQRFDKLTNAQKLRWMRMKTLNGMKYAAIGVAATVALPVVVVGGLSALTVKAAWEMLKLTRKGGLHLWKYIGKGLAATGKGLQKAGHGMQAQTAARLTKTIPPPPPEATRAG
ncbi:hypothetical protein PGT21_001762 [Puccinia graminis f. sp. tritici]|uniref:Uncharacterized protein n=1 Tax=Puccinia graminis f. sp. tritici TaxID=56615 RepID=A0A5B0QM06_PUCGR|nr:hypothetical protein PGTUg99_010408 [Puccinia graminis f. sp. tritici]KAA1105293.1 hypothetical protein PGT21_001886 [Puccinia graminis f. sp. tritici]KAA1114248.1 hypothetical protein PGT21_001762 [Puccinia graminis f. sp. tritici]KAA1124483.1 hypothetical protein PGTUg99_033842 [Puccinia graminis f. sp. tritici]